MAPGHTTLGFYEIVLLPLLVCGNWTANSDASSLGSIELSMAEKGSACIKRSTKKGNPQFFSCKRGELVQNFCVKILATRKCLSFGLFGWK